MIFCCMNCLYIWYVIYSAHSVYKWYFVVVYIWYAIYWAQSVCKWYFVVVYIWYAIYWALSVCKWYFVVWVVYTYEHFPISFADVHGAFSTPVVCRSDTIKQRLQLFTLDGWQWIRHCFACLIRNHAKCHLVFLGIICMEILLLDNLLA